MTRIIHQDFRHPSVRLCDRARDKFFVPNGLDWNDFKANGILVEDVRALGHHHDLINRLEAVAKEREEKEANNGRG
jgi:hypothetical protein